MRQYIIVNLYTQEVYRDVDGMTKIFTDYHEAVRTCGINELNDVWICELHTNYREY